MIISKDIYYLKNLSGVHRVELSLFKRVLRIFDFKTTISSMHSQRPATPELVKRILRKEAGFGCCICGHPILEYHHIIPYSVEKHFRSEDMMVLCPNHHEAATNGGLDLDEQRKAKNKPFNITRGLVNGSLVLRQTNASVSIAGSTVNAGAGIILVIGSSNIIFTRISEQGTLLLSIKLYSEENSLLAEIIDNDWISYVPLLWDIVFRHQKITIRNKLRDILLQIDCATEPVKIRGRFWGDGAMMTITDTQLTCGDAKMIGGGVMNGEFYIAGSKLGFRLTPRPITANMYHQIINAVARKN